MNIVQIKTELMRDTISDHIVIVKELEEQLMYSQQLTTRFELSNLKKIR